jgi:hypothetical protein
MLTIPKRDAEELGALLHTYRRLGEALRHARETAHRRGDPASRSTVRDFEVNLTCAAHAVAKAGLRSLYGAIWGES